MREEIISLGPDGDITSELEGFNGPACLEYAAQVAAALETMGVCARVDEIRMKDQRRPPEQTHSTQAKKSVETGR